MTWQLGSVALLMLALIGGFAWYERTRPDARIVALVATLAAFAALGRIAFAAIPNVKPTTDIVLISGYALGGAPGFVVGAVAGLTSNFFFGQGPWTPWQMAAWGLTGLIGAGLARATTQMIGRWTLAALCAVVGFAFAAVQDFGDWVTYSDHSFRALNLYLGKGVGFDLIHAAGCLVFALAFGPALARSLRRFAGRLRIEWLPGRRPIPASRSATLVALVVAASFWLASQPGVHGGWSGGGTGGGLSGLLGPGIANAQAATPTSYLLSAQNPDGGLGGAPGQASAQLYSGWAALGLAAEGYNPQDVRAGGSSLTDYISSGTPGDPGALERTILVAAAAGLDPQNFGGQNLVAALQQDIGGDGSVSDQVNLTAFAVLALDAAGQSPSSSTLNWLAHQQDSDGGFNFATAGGASDADDTGAALEALAGTGHDDVVGGAVSFLRSQQNGDGGFPATPGGASNAQSTAWAVQGLEAAGVDPGSMPHGSPLQYLRGLIASDGHVQYSSSSDQTPVWVTAQAAMALAGKPLPLSAVPRGGPGGAGTAHRGAGRHSHGGSGKGGSAARNKKAAAARRRQARMLLTLASGAGVAMAVVLAPVGAS